MHVVQRFSSSNLIEFRSMGSAISKLERIGIFAETTLRFGLANCSRGRWAGHIIVPVRDRQWTLVCYLALGINGARWGAPKLFPLVKPTALPYLYFSEPLRSPVEELLLVQGLQSVWRLWQHGYHRTVALLGSSCQPAHAACLRKLLLKSGRVWIVGNGDAEGDKFAGSAMRSLARYVRCNQVYLPTGKRPDTLDETQLRCLLGSK